MKSYLSSTREECILDYVREEGVHGNAGKKPMLGRKWGWRGKHRLDEHGKFVCGYKSWRAQRDVAKLKDGGRYHRDSLARDNSNGWDQYERGTEPGTACKHCGRLIESVVSHEEWIAYQDFRERTPSYGGSAKGYRGWFEPGAHSKPPGGKLGHVWAGKHTGEGDSFRCLYVTALRPALRIASEAGGCERCGRLRGEGQP